MTVHLTTEHSHMCLLACISQPVCSSTHYNAHFPNKLPSIIHSK